MMKIEDIDTSKPPPNFIKLDRNMVANRDETKSDSHGNEYVSNYVPTSMDPHIDSIDFRKDGQMIMATSALNRRYWSGDLWWYQSINDAPSVTKAKTGVRLNSGIVRAKIVNDRQIILALDSGGIQSAQFYTTKHDFKDCDIHSLELQNPIIDHDNSISDMDTWSEGDNAAVTVDRDGRICVWNGSLALMKQYIHGHPSGIVSVAANQSTNDMFATSGLDGNVKVWDMRQEKPATLIYSNLTSPPGKVSFVPGKENNFVIGTRTGEILNLDRRKFGQADQILSSFTVMDREIRELSWCARDPSMVGVCGDDTVVSVLKLSTDSQMSQVYTNNQLHSDFVRTLSWNPTDGILYSGGWDMKIVPHKISTS